jgi:hypothetical protein
MRSTDAFPSKYLKSGDVKAKPLIATISHVDMELVGQGQEQKEKPVLYLKDGQKPIVLNRTNFEAIEAAFGDTDEWPDRKIRVYCAPTRFQGKATDGIRIDPIVPKPAPKDDFNDEIKF